MHPALANIIMHQRAEPSRTGSVVITIYGDAIVPRGGSVGLGTLLAVFERLGVAGGVVRTTVSRLAADGWLERAKVGRNSFYRLSDKGRGTFAEAALHIYAAQAPRWAGKFDLLLFPSAALREAARPALEAAGFGSPLPGLWLAPRGAPVPAQAASAIRMAAKAGAEGSRILVAQSWRLDRIAAGYRRFLAAFGLLGEALSRGEPLSDAEAFLIRVLAVHQYRRVILRDPLLPSALLPPDWPGTQARALCAAIYHAVLDRSESWLDGAGSTGEGALPKPGPELRARFRG